jgi:putative endonuclease
MSIRLRWRFGTHARQAGIVDTVAYRVAMTDAWVYMLRCRDGSLYTGWSTDVPRRLSEHLAGKASKYTASRRPVELAFTAPMADRSAAMREEARIKALDREAKLALIAAETTITPRPRGGRRGAEPG